ncbi:MAG: hypothetical protein FVQ81_03320 [Candidatus Glassbacteria bacterium]|nr:hypothetical protein [Candidatus Glassbacteria bacterium]
MLKDDYSRINPEVEPHELVNFNLFRKLSPSGGRPVYVQFHRKGTPFGSCVPSQIYIHADEIEELLKTVPKAKIYQKKLPCGKIAFMLMTNWYESKVLKNPDLDPRAQIEFTVHCLNESLRFLQSNAHSVNGLNDSLRKISANLVLLTYNLLITDEIRNYLLAEVFYRNKNHLPHAMRVCMYTCYTVAVISSLKSIDFEPQLVANTIWGILIHDERFWRNNFAKQLESARSEWPAEVGDLDQHLKYVSDLDYCDDRPAAPMLRIATITDAFDELTACTHNTYVSSHSDAFTYLRQRMTDNLYRPYLEMFIGAFCSSASEKTIHVG